MSIDPTTFIVPSIKLCMKIYTYVKDVYGSAEQRDRFMQEVLALKEVLDNLKKRLEEDQAQNHSSMAALAMLFDPDKDFVKLVQRDLTKLEEMLRRGEVKDKPRWQLRVLWTKPVAAGIWPLDKADSNALLVRIERYKSLISLAMQDDIDQLVHEILRMGEESKEMLSEVTEAVADLARVIGIRLEGNERMVVAKWISKIDFDAYHAENSRKWLKGTGGWVLETKEFQKWVSRTSLPPVLWCYGNAGAGKSVAAAMIVEHLRSIPDNIVLVIVCRYSQDREYFGETHNFMCCLLRQLLQLESSSNVPPSLVDLYRKGIHPSKDRIRTLLIETAHIISRPIFIVLDALDECPLRFALAAAIQGLGNTFNLLITSREVFAEIKDYPSLHIRASDDDILALVNDKIPALPYVQEDDALQATVRTEIVEKADGMFLLASLKLWELEHDVTSKAAVREVLASIPASLDDAYRQIFDRIRAQGDRKKELALQVIMWIYIHITPIESPVLRFFLAFKISTSEPEFQEDRMPSLLDIINACGGLLQVTSSHETTKTRLLFIHYSTYEYISHFQDSILPKDHSEFAFNICTIALRHIEHLDSTQSILDRLGQIWLHLAQVLDSNQPAVVKSILEDSNFTRACTSVVVFNSRLKYTMPPWLYWQLIERDDSNLSTLDYAAAFRLRDTFRLARETKALDEHEFHRAMEILVACHEWNLVHEVWADGEYDINAYCDNIGSTAICEVFSSVTHSFICPEELRREFLQHPDTSMHCPRHDGLLGCCIAGWLKGNYRETLKDIAIMLERLYRDTKDGVSQPGRISVYPHPSRARSHPPDILDVITVLLQRADIDLDAHITRMVPREILLSLLMLPWNCIWYEESKMAEEVILPYARRPADIPDTGTSSHVPDADALADNVVPDTAQAVEALDVCDTPEPDSADNTPARVPSSEVLDDRVVPDTMRKVGAVDVYRMTAVHFIVGAAISLFIYLCYFQR